MGTRKLTFKAEAQWVKVFPDNRDMFGYEDAYREFDGCYTIQVKLDEDQMAELKASGSMLQGKDDPDSSCRLITFKRKHKDRFDWASGAPKVTNQFGADWDFEHDGPVGNGSTVEVVVTVYDTSRPRIKGTRLEEVKVLDLVPVPEVA